ncbi:MAG: hypothetical protein E6J43_03010 [Chloroflexi bacterium]|nr:MAG: hypothetical protein E6J43_03010 [Chloroflexota bacterium]
MKAAAPHNSTTSDSAWADASGRCFFAWRMAAACEEALREVHQAMSRQQDPVRSHALEKVGSLLLHEMRRWVRRGEELDQVVDHLPKSNLAANR